MVWPTAKEQNRTSTSQHVRQPVLLPLWCMRYVAVSVRLSVCLSPAGIVSKRLDGLRCTMRYEQIDK